MPVALFDLTLNSNAFNPKNLVFGKPVLYDEKGLLYPLKYRNDEGVCDIMFVFPKTRASYGLNTKAHLVDLTLGSKDNYMENPMYEFLSVLDVEIEQMISKKIPDVLQYEPIVQYSKKRDEAGRLIPNLEYGPHYTVGLLRRSNRYLLKVDGQSARSWDLFDVEGMLSPGALVQVAASIGGVYVNEQKIGRIRPKIHTLKNCANDIDINFQSQDYVFQEL